MKPARVYLRVSTDEQDLERQRDLIEEAKAQGYYMAGVYHDKASGTRSDRPGLQRMIEDLQPGDTVIAEKIDRITRAPLDEAEALIQQIKDKGARLAIPGIMDLSEIEADGMAGVVLESVQTLLLRVTLQMARDDYETRRERQRQGIAKAKAAGKYKGRPRDTVKRDKINALLAKGMGVRETARILGVSPATVSNVKREEAAQ